MISFLDRDARLGRWPNQHCCLITGRSLRLPQSRSCARCPLSIQFNLFVHSRIDPFVIESRISAKAIRTNPLQLPKRSVQAGRDGHEPPRFPPYGISSYMYPPTFISFWLILVHKVRNAAQLLDAADPAATVSAAMAKKFATDACFDVLAFSLAHLLLSFNVLPQVVNQALQIHGGYG